ncbi:hypothetical protein GCM10027416_08210 [Okibacterium endophyticum]
MRPSRPSFRAGRSGEGADVPAQEADPGGAPGFRDRRPVSASVARLPRWPFALVFLGVPLWWVLGIGDVAFILGAVVMAVVLIRRGDVRAPRGFGIWMLFLALMLFSVIGIDTGGRLIGFVYRAVLYVSMTVIFLYVYNGRPSLTPRYVAGVLTGYWLVVVAGGYLGVFFPLLTITTPLAYLMPDGLLANELVHEMVIRRATQFNPDSYLDLDPRPSAPFLYTNGWGNAYSMLMPVVIAYLLMVKGERRYWWLLVAIPVSVVPAVLTLNRGMFIGLAIALAYVVLRLLLMGRAKASIAFMVIGLLAVIAFIASPADDALTNRLDESSSTEDRGNLYQETFERTLESPLFGYGAPRPSYTEGAPSAGTQGQFWMVMFSHGFPAVLAFNGWLLWAFVRSLRRRDTLGLACNTVLLIISVESLYYGVTTSGLPIAMAAAALVLGEEQARRKRAPAPLHLSNSERTALLTRSNVPARTRTERSP